MIRVALDAAGGDRGVEPNVRGASHALREWPDLSVLFVGPRSEVEQALSSVEPDRNRIELVEASEVVSMADPATAPLRQKPNSSIRVAANLVREGKADALVSAGNTGAAMAAAKVVMGTIEGVDRPTLAWPLPTRSGLTVLTDVGANVDCKAHHLLQFAVMGSLYARILGSDNPRIALLSIGEEESKGDDLIRTVHKVLKGTRLNFVGNIDGKDIFSGKADVIVCDGVLGNVVLKTCESLVEATEGILRSEFSAGLWARLGYLMSRRVFSRIRKRLDYTEYGGVPLLGIRGTTVVCHGRSNARAIQSALGVAIECERRKVNDRIRAEIARLAETEADYFPTPTKKVIQS
jgi:glycerol-3-phosphate acyltransferase PlsX